MKKNTIRILSLMLSLLMLSACAPKDPVVDPVKPVVDPVTDPNAKKIVTIAMTSAWDSMMPMNSNSNYGAVVYEQIYDSLINGSNDGTYLPRLADSWTTNADSTEITFKLNKKAMWHDGKPVTADDVVASFKMYSNPAVESLSRYKLQYIAGTDESGAEKSVGSIAVTAKDANTVTIKMKNAMYPDTLLNDLTGIYIVPKHIFDGKTPTEINSPDIWAKPIGSGPFKFDNIVSGERMEFTKNPDFYLGAPEIDRLVVRIVETPNLLAGLISGDIDVIAGGGLGSILLEDWAMAREQKNLTTASIPTTSYQTLIMNTQQPYLTEKVRQALSMAINRKSLVDNLLQGEGVPVITPICPLSAYYDKSVEIWYDVAKAKQMLDEEKFPYDKELTFFVPTGNTTRERAAALIQEDFKNVGVKVKIQSVDFPTLMNNMREGKHDFGIIGSGGSLDPSESRQMISPDSSVNFGKLTDTELADIADAGTAALTLEARKPFFNKYQARIKEVIPMAYLYTTNTLMAYNNRLSGINVENFGSLNWSTWQWKVAAK